MSLFGDEDDVPSRPKAQQSSSSLFDDDPKPTGNSLFADDFHGDDSPWGFNPTPKKQKGSLIKSLLPASEVPDSYIDAFDRVLESGERAGSGISVGQVKKLLGSSGLASDKEAKILEIVSQPEQESAGVGRNEFNVLYALIGLAQDGYDASELSLDSVDERKRSELLAVFLRPEARLTVFACSQIYPCPPSRCHSRRNQSPKRTTRLQRWKTRRPHRPSSNPHRRQTPRRIDRVHPCASSRLATLRRTLGGRLISIGDTTIRVTPPCLRRRMA